MNHFELHQEAQAMSDTHSAYELAREVLRLREALDNVECSAASDAVTGRSHSDCQPIRQQCAALPDRERVASSSPTGDTSRSFLASFKVEIAIFACMLLASAFPFPP